MIAVPRTHDEVMRTGAAMDASTKAAAAINTATKAAADAWSDVTIGGKDADTLMMAAIADALVAVPRTSDEDRRLRAGADVLGMSNLPPLEAGMVAYLSGGF